MWNDIEQPSIQKAMPMPACYWGPQPSKFEPTIFGTIQHFCKETSKSAVPSKRTIPNSNNSVLSRENNLEPLRPPASGDPKDWDSTTCLQTNQQKCYTVPKSFAILAKMQRSPNLCGLRSTGNLRRFEKIFGFVGTVQHDSILSF